MLKRRLFGLVIVALVAAACQQQGGQPLQPPPAGGAPGFNPVNWKKGDTVTSLNGHVTVTMANIGPKTWSYEVKGNCIGCNPGGPNPQAQILSVQIVSPQIPVHCNNADPKNKAIVTASPGWTTNDPSGNPIAGPKGVGPMPGPV